MTEWILALLAFAGLTIFLAVIVSFVPSPDLIIVVVICVAMAAFDFLRDLIARK